MIQMTTRKKSLTEICVEAQRERTAKDLAVREELRRLSMMRLDGLISFMEMAQRIKEFEAKLTGQ